MRGEGNDHGYVCDDANAYKGIVTRQAVEDAIEQHGAKAALATFAAIAPTVQPDASLEDILSSSLEQPYPVAVVCDEGDLRGVVSRKAFISVLTGKGDGEENPAAE